MRELGKPDISGYTVMAIVYFPTRFDIFLPIANSIGGSDSEPAKHGIEIHNRFDQRLSRLAYILPHHFLTAPETRYTEI